ncbi:hypothetical protein GQR36_07070 [Enterococcus termitis]|nr:hypothetical protein RV18_GL001256 [Enterococcus termitis]
MKMMKLKELTSSYLLILEKSINFSKYTLRIKADLFSVIFDEIATLDFMSHFSNYSNICVTDKTVKY